MARTPINLIRGDAAGSDTDYRDVLPVNMTAVVQPLFNAAGYMIQEPGLRNFGQGEVTGTGPDRGGVWNERVRDHYRISGQRLIRMNASGFRQELGTVTGIDTASLPYSLRNQAIIADGKMWLYNTTAGFRQVTDPDVGEPTDGVWIDGLFLLTDGERLYHTELNDDAAIDPLDFGAADFMPDGIVALDKTSDDKAIVFGRYSTQFFRFDPANTNFAFSNIPSRAIKSGIVGKDAWAEVEGVYYILGGDRNENVSLRQLGVNHSERIATREIEKIINSYSEEQMVSAILEPRAREGYAYLLVHLPNDTLIFNITLAKQLGISQAWSVLKTDVQGSRTYRGVHGVWDPRLGFFVYGDKRDDNIGLLDDTDPLHYGEIAEWELNTPFIQLDGQSVDQLEIEMLPGFNDAGDANVAVSMTYDGVTHGREYDKRYSRMAVYDDRFICRPLGRVDNWFSIKLRGATRSRMAFARGYIDHG